MKNDFWIESWDKFLLILFSLLGAGFFSSGVVTWIASNWAYFSKFEKLFATQGLLVLLIGGSLWLSRRANSINKIQLLWFVAAVVIGGLFALIGQIYQTGADVWELFALWALLQVPLWMVLPNVAGILLWIVTVNLAIGFYFERGLLFSYSFSSFYLVALFFNITLLGLFERFPTLFHDKWRIVIRTLSLLVATASVFALFSNDSLALFIVLLMAGLLFYYSKKRFDPVNYVLFYCTLVIAANFLLVRDGEIYVMALITVVAVIFLGYQLTRWIKEKYAHIENNIGVTLLYFFLTLLAIALILVVLYLNGVRSEGVFLILAFMLLATGLFIKNTVHPLISQTCFAAAIVLTVLYGTFSFDYDLPNPVESAAFVAGFLLIYAICQSTWVRSIALIAVLYQINYHYPLSDYIYWLILAYLVSFLFASKAPVHLNPLGWALLLFDAGNYYRAIMSSYMTEADALPEVDSFSAFIRVISNGYFDNMTFSLAGIMSMLIALSPVIIFVILQYWQKKSVNVVVLVGLLGFVLLFTGYTWLSICLSLLLLAFANRNRTLLLFSALWLLWNLSEYYYFLAIPLLYKSFLLLSNGVLFGGLAIYLYRKAKLLAQAVSSEQYVANRKVPIAALLSLAATLGLANYAITQNEDVLKNGTPILLELAPVDPRSLMQGDYMELSYTILGHINDKLYKQDQETELSDPFYEPQMKWSHKVYALVSLDQHNVATLCRLETEKPTSFSGCAEGVYLPVKWDWGQLRLPSHQYFFAEGKAAHYNAARYGEFRFKNGKALLSRLLNEQYVEL